MNINWDVIAIVTYAMLMIFLVSESGSNSKKIALLERIVEELKENR